MNTHLRLRPTLIVALLSCSHALAASDVGKGEAVRLLETILSSAPAEDRAVSVRKVEIDMGPGTLVLDQGVLVPAAPVNGRTLEVAFVGDAWFRFSTPDSVEYHQLELFTGETSLLTPVTHAVLVTGNEKTFESILHGERATGDPAREAVKLLKTWVEGSERQGFAADLSMVKSLMGDPQYQGYFAVWCRSPEQGDFYYIVNPSQTEPVTLGQFVPMDLSGLDVWQQRRFKNNLRLYNFFGRFAEFSVEHPGQWDTWASTGTQTAPGAQERSQLGPEPEHYTINLYVNPLVELDAKASAGVRLRTGSASVRTVVFSLYSGLRVTGVFGPHKEPLDFIRRERTLHVFLAQPAPPGAVVEVQVDYEGDLVQTLLKDESYALLDTEAWYPRTGEADRATYDVTLRRPKKYAVLASGRAIESGEDDGVAWERRTLDVPGLGFSFELGRFDIVIEKVGHVETTFGFPPEGSGPTKQARDTIVATVKRCLPVFEEKLGPYPLDYLTVVSVDRGFSQGMLSMVTLSETAMQDLDAPASPHLQEWAEERRALTIAHEISHQWWGNWVGWASYRDQWLSESLASYSALQFGAETAKSKAAFMVRNARDWRSSLMSKTFEGRTIASIGPVTLGLRLRSSKSGRAYESIVYDKGAAVFRMLSRIVGEAPFARMLGELTRSVANRTIDTATFLKAIERMSGQDLQPFAEQFIYGTDIPDIYYRYEIAPAEDGKGWTIRGEARQMSSGRENLKIVKDLAGSWRVERRGNINVDVPATVLVVPFQVVITPPEQVKPGELGQVQSARGFGGRLVLKERLTPFLYTIPEKPERFELDQLGEVLAVFHDESWTPKQTLRLQALDLDKSGDSDAARKLLYEALGSPVYSTRAIAWMSPKRKKDLDQEEEARFEDARIHTLMARLLIDRGDLDEAEKEIVTGEKLLKEPDKQAGSEERRVLRGRIDLARGDAEAAFQRLRSGLQRWQFGAEGFALLAVAATASGHDRIAVQAMERAESRGVDVRALREARAAAAKQ